MPSTAEKLGLKPSIGVILEDIGIHDYEVEVGAFAHYAELDLNYSVIRLTPTIEPGREINSRLLDHLQNGSLFMIAVAGEIGEEGFVVNHKHHLEQLRKAIGQEIPAYILDEGSNEDEIVDFGNNIFGANPQSQVFLDKVSQLAEDKQVEFKKSQGNLDSQIEALLAAYRGNFPDVGVDDNTAIIHAFLR